MREIFGAFEGRSVPSDEIQKIIDDGKEKFAGMQTELEGCRSELPGVIIDGDASQEKKLNTKIRSLSDEIERLELVQDELSRRLESAINAETSAELETKARHAGKAATRIVYIYAEIAPLADKIAALCHEADELGQEIRDANQLFVHHNRRDLRTIYPVAALARKTDSVVEDPVPLTKIPEVWPPAPDGHYLRDLAETLKRPSGKAA